MDRQSHTSVSSIDLPIQDWSSEHPTNQIPDLAHAIVDRPDLQDILLLYLFLANVDVGPVT